jgi:fatty-acyl-CoA synthase
LEYLPVYANGVPRHPDSLIRAYEAAGYWGEATISDRYHQIASNVPHKTALIEGDRRFNYSELTMRIGQVRDGLADIGIRQGDLVAVQLPNWWEQVVVSLAIVELGAILVPVSIRLRGELKYILEFTKAKTIIAPDEFHGFSHKDLIFNLEQELPSLRHVILVRSESEIGGSIPFESLPKAGTPSPRPDLDSNSPWEIIFTSGTTSDPKGVVRTHNNTLRTMSNLSEHYDFILPDGSDVVMAILPISFIFAQYLGALSSLLFGATLVLQAAFEPKGALDLIEREKVTYFGIVPSIVERFFEVDNLEQRHLETLRFVSPAGEAVTRERKERIHEAFRCDVLESYGLSEFTWPLGQVKRAGWEKKLTRTGVASPGTELKIVETDGDEVGPGMTGELLLRGPTRFPGYFNNPEATNECIDEDGWFHTGDLAQVDDQAFYSIVGRAKDVIKRKGAMIVPHEIEDALSEHPDVRDVSVVGLSDPTHGEIACACVVPRSGAHPTEDELIAFMRGKIATYKLPERIELMDALPVSPVGKVLKSELITILQTSKG